MRLSLNRIIIWMCDHEVFSYAEVPPIRYQGRVANSEDGKGEEADKLFLVLSSSYSLIISNRKDMLNQKFPAYAQTYFHGNSLHFEGLEGVYLTEAYMHFSR